MAVQFILIVFVFPLLAFLSNGLLGLMCFIVILLFIAEVCFLWYRNIHHVSFLFIGQRGSWCLLIKFVETDDRPVSITWAIPWIKKLMVCMHVIIQGGIWSFFLDISVLISTFMELFYLQEFLLQLFQLLDSNYIISDETSHFVLLPIKTDWQLYSWILFFWVYAHFLRGWKPNG